MPTLEMLAYRRGWMHGAQGGLRNVFKHYTRKAKTSQLKAWRQGYDDAMRLRLAMFAFSAAEYGKERGDE